MLNKIKEVYNKSIKSILVIQILMFIIFITVLTKAYFDDSNDVKILFIYFVASFFLSGIENILLKKEKWLYIGDFIFGTLSVFVYLFFFN